MKKIPAYYVVRPREVADVLDIIESLGDMHGFCRGNIIKYLYRAGNKGSALDDLLKARNYLNRYIEIVEQELEQEGKE